MTFPLFLLGGHDLEMLTIRELLQAYAPDRFIDKRLGWGAAASAYRVEIEEALQQGRTPVLVELVDDMGLERRVILIDHHGPLAGADQLTALHQVFALLGLPSDAWTRHMELVAANDRGHIKGMQEAGATMDEIVAIRAADRATQGITEEQEQQAAEAIAAAETACDGMLTTVHLPNNKTAAVADRLAPELGGAGYENLLVISPDELNLFGEGHLIQAVAEAFPAGWYGGSLPERGFFGISPVPEELAAYIREILCQNHSQN